MPIRYLHSAYENPILLENWELESRTNDDTEDVISDGRYYHDEAKVPGVEHSDLGQGHVFVDSLGGVSNTTSHHTTGQHAQPIWGPVLYGGRHPEGKWRDRLRGDYHVS